MENSIKGSGRVFVMAAEFLNITEMYQPIVELPPQTISDQCKLTAAVRHRHFSQWLTVVGARH